MEFGILVFAPISMPVLAISACVVAHILIGKLRASSLKRSGDTEWEWTDGRKLKLATLSLLSGFIGLFILFAAFPTVEGATPSMLPAILSFPLSFVMLVGVLLMGSNMRDNLRDKNQVGRPSASFSGAIK